MREFLYYHLGGREEVTESIAQWNNKTGKIYWKRQKIKPNWEYQEVIMTKTTQQLLEMWFPDEDSPFKDKPEEIGTHTEWEHHWNSLIAMVVEIKQFFIP